MTAELSAAVATGDITLAQLEGMTAADAYALADFGWMLLEHGRAAAAALVFEALTIGNPRHAYFHALHGAALHRDGRTEEALAAYDRALAVDASEPAALVNRAEILLGREGPALEEIAALLGRVIDGDPESLRPETRRARALAAVAARLAAESCRDAGP